ncbi:MAG: class I SAM-dependent methyltransferase [Bacteroidetes bacterium]|mgnify:CR=1 FL=1|nr:MAG: class I SAM-dependent methyltransferase [Bacteroidota bacterium]REK06521.1 MAG: class I SAM-dependent methyltransferase [Bacteroidota bacterium]REK33287.1 MAG: class I SAM-dependent methyltransferase [Bacteroidota bacterium]REK49687.1 MAG: class I SAM-dependent methyltransferase [Bacteroidota bacterium]
MTPEEILKVLEIPEWDTASPVKTEEARFIYDFIREHGLSRTLEVGFAFAKSASHIMAATGRPHIAMDPFQENYKHLGLKNIEKLGLRERLDFHGDFSHNVLPELVRQGKKFDFIFIDGDHKFDGILVDFYYSNLLLENGGYILMHDTWMRSTRLVERFVQTNLENYEYIKTPLRNFSLFRKKGEDKRDGMYFREFYTTKSIFVHKMINWMANGKDSFLKRTAMKVKDLIK